MLRLLPLLLLCLNLSFAMSVKEDPDFTAVYKQPQNSDKLVLMIYTVRSCPQCAYMKQKVFTDPAVAPFMQKHFVVVEKDIQRDDLPREFEYFGVPTIFFVDKGGKLIEKFSGSARAKPFLRELQGVVEGGKQ